MQNGGPLADLTARLRELHLNAGEPSTRRIAARTAGAVSHSTVHQALTGKRLPRWGALELIVEALGGEAEEFRKAWKAARLQESGPEEEQHVDPVSTGERYRLMEWNEVLRGRGNVARHIAERLIGEGRVPEATEFLKREVGKAPASPLTVLYLRILKDQEESAKLLEALRNVEMESAEAAEEVAGFMEDRLGDIEAACRHMRNALRLDPGNAFQAWAVAGYLDTLGRTEEALRYYRRAAERCPDDDDYVGGYLMALVREGEFAEAERFGRAVPTRGDEATEWLAQALALQGKLGEAEQELLPLLDQGHIALILARMRATAGRYDDALVLLERHVGDEEHGLAFQAEYVDALIAAGRTEEADRMRERLEAEWWEREGRRS
ncbi:hypothetical protein [Kitasatospora sp. NPDC101183]|uniref:hypothetical protein n=1 Tax=Kitasatospora sp. NPDC101183 TaxID=3364100 RepID=UPI00382213A0